ncbi:PDZ domain-containing protein, partial [bacterium]|nr:PDZ domain-containing protein [bacterium]
NYRMTYETEEIEPSKLFSLAWRVAKNEYVDETMNNQDWNKWKDKYSSEIKTQEDAVLAINTMLLSLNDSYTTFLQSGVYSKQKIVIDSQITGIGIIFHKVGDDIVIYHVVKNSPAQKAKILQGDKIIKINSVNVRQLSAEDIQKIIEKKHSDIIRLQIQRGDKIIHKKLKKKVIPIENMQYKITKDNIGIIKLANVMGENALEDFQNIIQKTNNTKGIIIDLRDNYGGILANALQIADMIIADKKIISIEAKGHTKYQVYGDENSIFKPKPIVILVNRKTASAAEILAGALKESYGAIIIGQNTYGKNTIQQVISLPNGTGMIISTNKYILPNGEDIYKIGITPDVLLSAEETANTYLLTAKAKDIIKTMSENKENVIHNPSN